MKLIHFADLHIGVESYSRPDPETGLPSRLHDFLAALDELVEFALSEPVDLVVFAGDAYKSRDPSQTHQREFAKRIRRLSSAGIPVFLLIGNHDISSAASRANALDIFHTLAVENVYVGARIATTLVPTGAGPVQVVAVPWPNRSTLLALNEFSASSITDIDRKIEELVAEAIDKEAERLDPSLPAILTAHVAMQGSNVKTGSEEWMTVGRFPQLPPSAMASDRFDYVALGHHHIQQAVSQHPPMYYSGSMQRIDFGEEHDDKGFMVVTLDPSSPAGSRATEIEFHRVNARRFVTVNVTVRGDDATAEVVGAVHHANVRDAIVRVRIALTPRQNAALRDNDLREALAPAHFVASVSRDLSTESRRRVFGDEVPERMAPIDVLQRYFDAGDKPLEYRQQLLAHARALIAGEDVAATPDEAPLSA